MPLESITMSRNAMVTNHRVFIGSSKDMSYLQDKSVSLIVTSPPYPMIEMWDEIFKSQDPTIDIEGNPNGAFEKMHDILNHVWAECDRVLADSGFVCINIGDATRNVGGSFQLYSNHSKIINYFLSLNYSLMPDVIWKKPSTSPNKFMGSGMYPPGAYVTYEHEYILIFRKGTKRLFEKENTIIRRESAYFWEERNVWFSDIWDVRGVRQSIHIPGMRERSGAFPFEIPYRLINMFSIKGDVVLDPFAGTGTTALAAMASERNSVSVEYDFDFGEIIRLEISNAKCDANSYVLSRINKHLNFIASLPKEKVDNCYINKTLNTNVKTRQEVDISISLIDSVDSIEDGNFSVSYSKIPPCKCDCDVNSHSIKKGLVTKSNSKVKNKSESVVSLVDFYD